VAFIIFKLFYMEEIMTNLEAALKCLKKGISLIPLNSPKLLKTPLPEAEPEQKYSKKYTLKIDPKMFSTIKEISDLKNISVAELIREVLRTYLGKKEKIETALEALRAERARQREEAEEALDDFSNYFQEAYLQAKEALEAKLITLLQ
jgi:Arc/MetJ-type ribon-helix-helix transcriptional regulator